MFLTYIGVPTITENTWFSNLSISTNDILQCTEIRWNEFLNLYPGQFTVVTTVSTLLANDSVTTVKILDDNVTNDKLANMTRWTIKVWGVAWDPTDLDANDDWKILIWDGTDVKSVAVSWDITIANTWATTIWANKILKWMVSHEVLTVSIVAWTSWTATAVTWWQIIGWYVTAITWTESVKTVDLLWTTVTVTLTWSDTATIKVVILKAS